MFDLVKRVQGKSKKAYQKGKLDPSHPDFDSEEEYGGEAPVDYVSSEEEEEDEEMEEELDEFVSDEEKDTKKSDAPKVREEPEYKVKQAPQNEHLIMREATLIALIKKSFRNRVIIFSNEKVQCTRLHALLTIYGFSAAEVHGNMDQAERLQAVEDFQCGKVCFLIATDVVARGLDIPNVHAIINFSFPTEPKRYIHRIGRTARAGQHGVAITLCNEEERKDLKKLSRKLN
jgi:ATP-dependent RNA helicase DDX27